MSRQIVHVGRRIKVCVERLTDPSGNEVVRDIVLHPGAVAILPFIDDQTICLLHNHRSAIGSRLWEIPAGTLEPGEDPLEAAKRELEEETGHTGGTWTRLGEFIPSPGVMSEVIHLFVARDILPGVARPEPGEDLLPQPVPLSRALNWCLDGTIRDGKTLTALLLHERVARAGT
ncbi:MAG: NUDIX hydrolase [Planctomycetota bacterium]|jgi:ADP-ribose pyrophosphatase